MTEFTDLALAEPLLRALMEEGYTTPTPIQTQAIPALLAGRDLLGIAQTGTGKTAAFALPLLQRLAASGKRATQRHARVLVLTPTRELAIQILESFRTYGRHLRISSTVVFGGVGHMPQIKAMGRGVDVLVATPGRLLDHMATGAIRLEEVEALVLDEADRMLDMGFIRPIRQIVEVLPRRRQTLLFSATMPPEIAELAAGLLHEPERIEVTPVSSTAERVEQRVLFVDRANKTTLLAKLLSDPAIERALVFSRTKHGADRVAERLVKVGIPADAIHGNKAQNARQRTLAAFKDGSTRVLIATDIAARGIDIAGISHVFNFDLPYEPESYVHRIGRTARAGAEGIAIALCEGDDLPLLRQIERLIGTAIPIDENHHWHEPDLMGAHLRNRQRGGQGRGPRASFGPSRHGERGHGADAAPPAQGHAPSAGGHGGHGRPSGRPGRRVYGEVANDRPGNRGDYPQRRSAPRG